MGVLTPSTVRVAVAAWTSKIVQGDGEQDMVNCEMALVSAVKVIVKAEFLKEVLPTLPVAKP